jgi:hypothetical protein
MGTSSYQLFKLHFLSIVPLAKDAVHIYVGVLALLVATALLRLPVRSYRALLPGLVLSLVMEALDLRDDLSWLGYLRWDASLKDVVNTNVLPLLIVVLSRRGFFGA